MRMRTRKLIGAVALLVLVIGWALLAYGRGAGRAPLARASAGRRLLRGGRYVVAGLGWVLPAMPLIAWMVKPDDGQSNTSCRNETAGKGSR